MSRIKYSRWDGTQTWRNLDEEELADQLFKELSNYMNWSLSAQESLEWLMRQGLRLPNLDMRIMGTDELLQELRRKRQDAFSQYNFNEALDDIRKKIDEIVEREITTARSELGSIHPEFQRREETLRSLSARDSEAIEELKGYDQNPEFLDREAKRLFDELMNEAESIEEMEQFILRQGRQFQGPESLDYEGAKEVMEQFNQMADLSEALRTGNFQEISMDDLKDLLGEEATNSIIILSDFTKKLEKSGYIRSTDEGIKLTPRGFRQIGQNALNEIFRTLKKEQLGLHPLNKKGTSKRDLEASTPYEFGKTLDIDIMSTLKNAMRRGVEGGRIRLDAKDFEVFEESHDTQTTTVLMLDMSWSMSRDGRFPAAKRVALAMDHLIRTVYPRDNYYTVGFSTRAREMNAEQLTEATWDPSDPFTNLQEGLFVARQMFRRHRATNRQVIIVTDGQPTATHIDGYTNAQWPGFMGSIPPDIYRDTLKEVDNCTRENVSLNIFMLDDNPVLVKFVEEIIKINKGKAFYSLPQNLGKYLLVDYLNRRKKQIA